jgi:hypothetical protein
VIGSIDDGKPIGVLGPRAQFGPRGSWFPWSTTPKNRMRGAGCVVGNRGVRYVALIIVGAIMYNLIVTSEPETWDFLPQNYEFNAERYLEHTEQDLCDRFKDVSDPAVAAEVCAQPALFMYEEDVKKPGWLGRVTQVRRSLRGVELAFTVDKSTPIEWAVLRPLLFELGISPKTWETRRTHWAIKNCDLEATLRQVYPHLAGGSPVAQHSPHVTSAVVEHALADAERLVSGGRGALSAVDRVHTALHGYLRAVALETGLSLEQDADIVTLFAQLREKHSAFAPSGSHHKDIAKITRGLAKVIDALNVLRNRASLAHPNDQLLDETEAMLFVNCVHTILRYVDSRLLLHRKLSP